MFRSDLPWKYDRKVESGYLILCGRTDYKAELSTSLVGCMTRLEKYRLDMEQAKLEYEKPFQYEEELKTKQARQFELNTLLDLDGKTVSRDRRRMQKGEIADEKGKENRNYVGGIGDCLACSPLLYPYERGKEDTAICGRIWERRG